MTAPLKPWERAGVNSRAFGGDVGYTLPPVVRYVLLSRHRLFVIMTLIIMWNVALRNAMTYVLFVSYMFQW